MNMLPYLTTVMNQIYLIVTLNTLYITQIVLTGKYKLQVPVFLGYDATSEGIWILTI